VLTADYKVLQPRLLLHPSFVFYGDLYYISYTNKGPTNGTKFEASSFLFYLLICFFFLSFFLCYQEIDVSGEASEVYAKAPFSNLAPDSAIAIVVPYLLHTENVS